jgi:hypothetical protein
MGEKRLYRTHLTRELADERRVRAAIDVRARLDDVDGMTRDRVRDAGGEPGDDLLRRGEAGRLMLRLGGGHDASERAAAAAAGPVALSSARPVFVSPRPTRRSVIYLFVGDVQRTFSVLMRIHVPGTFDCRLPRHRDIFATSSSLTVAVSILATRDARRAIRRISPRAIAIARAF